MMKREEMANALTEVERASLNNEELLRSLTRGMWQVALLLDQISYRLKDDNKTKKKK